MTSEEQAHLAQLRRLIEGGGQLDRSNALWLLDKAEGGFWGRAAARMTQQVHQHREALKAICNALVTGESNRWGAHEWAPIKALLDSWRGGAAYQVPDWPFRLVEAHEDRE